MFHFLLKIGLKAPSECNPDVMGNYNPFYFHSSAPSFHSWASPAARIKIKNTSKNMIFVKVTDCKIMGMGMISVISTSKIKKITAMR